MSRTPVKQTHEGAVKSADRVFDLLEYLADAKGATFASIVRDLGLPNSSAHQLLQTIAARGFIDFDHQSRLFRLGFRLWEVAQSYAMAEDIAALAQPYMDELRDQTLETVQLAQLDGLENVYLAISESPHAMKLVSSVGSRLSAHATGLGKVLLAGLEPADLTARLEGATLSRYTDKTITTRKALLKALEQIRERGYGEDNEEYVVGCRCVAVPLRNAQGASFAAMSVSIPTPRYSEATARRARSALTATVSRLEERIARG
jgi:DNA-binding IclR family transcriptional regulator